MGRLSCFPGWRFSSSKNKEVTDSDSQTKDQTTKLKGVNTKVWPGPPGDEIPSKSSTSPTRQNDLRDSLVFENLPDAVDEHGTKDGSFTGAEVQRMSSASESFLSSLKHVEEWVKNLEELPFKDDLSDVEMTEEDQEVKDFAETESPEMQLNNLVVQSVSPLSATAHLNGIGLRSIPILGAFSNLRSLSISGNSIVRISPGCLPGSLHFLDLSRNNISAIEGLRGLNRLRILNLSHNRISRVGHGLGNCTNIRELYLSGNKIGEVEGLHRLRKLLLLDLSNNRLTTAKSLLQLPGGNYSCLQVLNLLGNAVVLNLGEDQLRRLVSTITPRLTYLNKQAVKTAPALGRASEPGGAANLHCRKARRSSGSKAKRVESLQAHSRKNGSGTRRRKHF